MKTVWLVWYRNPQLGKRTILWGVYTTEARALEECDIIERDFKYKTFYTFEIVHD